MNDRVTILTERVPPESSREPSGRLSLPADLLEQARGRVRLIGFLVLGATLLDLVTGLASWDGGPMDRTVVLVDIAGSLVALALILATRWPRLGHWTVLNLGLLFEFFNCLIISTANPWFTYQDTGHFPSLTWATPLIILFPLIVPCPPVRMLVVALACAATAPGGLAILAYF